MSEDGQIGVVSIVGAGPGDAGLLTMRGRALIDAADAIVYDALINPDLLPPGAKAHGTPELYFVGKRGETRAAAQDDVGQLLVTLARAGKRVVRLKGGDPFMFGRGSEDAQALFEAQIPFEIVPGVTAGVAVPAYAGIPVTHKTLASSVTFVSGRDDPSKGDTLVDWRALAKVGGTIVVYNGLRIVGTIASEMIEGGMPGEMPVAAIASGTRAEQRTIVATLETLAREVELAAFSGPVTIVIGWSVLLRDEIAWFDQRPLFGKRIGLVASSQSTETLQERLKELGADVVALPAPVTARLELAELREDIDSISEYQWIVFTSPEAVTIFWEQLLTLGRDTRALAGIRVAAIGPQTAAALLDRGITVDVLPERFAADTLMRVLESRSDVGGSSLLYVCDDSDDGNTPEELGHLGADVTVRTVYRYVYDAGGTERIRRQLERGVLDLITFTSASSVAQYVRSVGDELMSRAPTAAADDATADALRAAGIDVLVEGGTSGINTFADEIERVLTSA